MSQISMLKETTIFFAGRLGGAVIGFAALAIYTRLLGSTDYGIFALVLSAGLLLHAVAIQWIPVAAARFIPATEGAARTAMVSSLGGAFGVLTLIGLGVLAAGGLAVQLSDVRWLIPATGAVAVALAFGWMELNIALSHAGLKSKVYAAGNLLRALFVAALSLAGIALGWGGWGLVFGFVAGNLAAGSLFVRSTWPALSLKEAPNGARLRMLIAFGVPSAAGLLLGELIAYGDRFLLAYFLDAAAVGLYAVPADLTLRTLYVIMGAAVMSVTPRIIRAHEAGDTAGLNNLLHTQFRLLGLVCLPGAVAFIQTRPLYVPLLLGTEYQDTALALIPPLAAGTALFGFATLYASLSFSLMRRPGQQAWALFSGAVVNLGLNAVLIPQLGIMGAALATLLSYGVVLAAMAALGRRLLVLPVPWRSLSRLTIAAVALGLALEAATLAGPGWLAWAGTGLVLSVFAYCVIAFDWAELGPFIPERLRGALRRPLKEARLR